MNTIQDVKLFKKLKKKDKEFASKVLEISNIIEELINKKTTINFPNYTNHDIKHSINIMDTMYELIQQNIDDFNQLELALMIYAALFHDIGMSLADEEISKIKNNTSKYLYGQSFDLIKKNSASEEFALQEVIRLQHGKIANDLINNVYNEYFQLPNTSISFAKDLGLICQSHTESETYLSQLHIDSLKGDYPYNPQFIAILLRVADILDIDATRTPFELYKSLNLNEYSNEEWLKNLSVENTKKIFKRNNKKFVRLDGSVKDIKVHRKLLNYVQWIENELTIAVEKTSDMKKKYLLDLNTKVQNNIKPIGYTVPDLKLNMDYQAITSLLMGESVYGKKSLGLRELLQNSIDACMVKKEKLSNEYKPTIDINILKDKNQFIVKDNGMGMNENIIKKYFLNIGKSYYKSPDFLNYEHSYKPIGNFGIGFLSCFMLSENVQVVTKYLNDKYKYTIDLEQNSEYISFIEDENYENDSGTEIILNYQTVLNAMDFIEDDLEELLSAFITENILLEDFDIKINSISIESDNEIKKSEYIIDVNKYAKNLFGTIHLNKHEYFKSFDTKYDNINSILYFNGDNLIKLKDIKELDLDDISINNQIQYCKVPILNFSANEKYNTLSQTFYLDEHEAFNSLKDDIKGYVYIFLKNDFIYEEVYQGVSSTDYALEVFGNNNDLSLYINDIRSKANVYQKYYTPVYIIENVNLLHKDINSILFFSNDNYISNKEIYIKNIKTNTHFTKQQKVDFIYISNLCLNIKDNKIIHEYALKNFDLTSDEKILLKEFIDTYYSEDSILLNR
ncbi:HD domain-containing protein [Sulfurimonas sp.]|uniref:HD domain-containing protein n=1 Tax=Sulfurimonas sp. TaxID=2022749 RepID=UPI003D14C163